MTKNKSPFVGIANEVHDFKQVSNWLKHNGHEYHQYANVMLNICSRCGFDCTWPNEVTTIPCVPQAEAPDAELDQETEDRITGGGTGEVEF
jgi:hypothetical protein